MPSRNKTARLKWQRQQNAQRGIVAPYRKKITGEGETTKGAERESPLGNDNNNKKEHAEWRSWLRSPFISRLSWLAKLPGFVKGALLGAAVRYIFLPSPPNLEAVGEGVLQFVDQLGNLWKHPIMLFIYRWILILGFALRELRSLGKYILIAWSIGSYGLLLVFTFAPNWWPSGKAYLDQRLDDEDDQDDKDDVDDDDEAVDDSWKAQPDGEQKG